MVPAFVSCSRLSVEADPWDVPGDVASSATQPSFVLLARLAMKTYAALALATLYLPAVSHADFVGLSSEVVAAGQVVDGRTLATVRIYATFDDPSDVVYVLSPMVQEFEFNGVVIDLFFPLQLETTDPLGFYQHPLGANTSAGIDPVLVAANPDLAFDSWLTIGLEDATGNVTQDLNVDWDDFNGSPKVDDVDGAIFTDPLAPQAIATSGRVMLAQLSVGLGELITGTFNMQGVLGAGNLFFEMPNNNFVFEACAMPATDLGYGTRSSEGAFPKFGACGDFAPGGSGALKLRRTPPFSFALVFFSLAPNPVPLFGDTFVPELPYLLFKTRVTNALGETMLPVNGIDTTIDLTAQWLVLDPVLDEGVALSNALVLHLGP